MPNMSLKKNEMPAQPADVGNGNFDEVALGYTEEQALDEAARCLHCKNKPCREGCPVGIDIPAFIARVAEKDYEGAYQVIAESSQGGDQSSIDTQVVFPGQTVEYTVRVDPQIPADQAYSVTAIKLSDTYSEYTTANKQTLEITDLGTGGIIPKSAYKVQWDEKAHSFEATFAKDWVAANWKAGSNPRVLLRFEAKVNEDAPTDRPSTTRPR